jgi:hypothetical protein
MDRPDAIVRAAVACCVIAVGVPVALFASLTIAPSGDPLARSSYNFLWILAVLVIGLGGVAGWISRGWSGFAGALLGIPLAVALIAPNAHADSVGPFIVAGIVIAVLVTPGYAIGRAVRRERASSRERPSPRQTGAPPEAYGGGTREGRGDGGAA